MFADYELGREDSNLQLPG